MSNTIRVVLADDHVFVRDGIKSLLENEAKHRSCRRSYGWFRSIENS